MKYFVSLIVFFCISSTFSAPVPVQHMVIIHKSGEGLSRRTTKGNWVFRGSPSKYTDIVDGLEQYAKQKSKRHLVLIIHGGLNSREDTIRRAREITPELKSRGYYPIFVSWNSSLVSAYLDHLLWVRRGNDNYKWLGVNWAPILTPFYFASDVGGAILKSPIVFIEGFWRTGEALPYKCFENSALKKAQKAEQTLVSKYRLDPDMEIAVDFGESKLNNWEKLGESTLTLANTPFRAGFAPFFHSLGTPAWNMMLRRIDLMFEEEDDSHAGRGSATPPSGELTQFLRVLKRFIEINDSKTWEVTIVCHSMGAIVANELLKRSKNHSNDYPEIHKLVYMAPACSQRDFEHSVISYMLDHPHTTCSILTLEMRAELYERNYLVLPQGSALFWIDDCFAQPNSEFDHTLGRFTNLMLASHRIPQTVRPRMSFRAYPYSWNNSVDLPTKHGDFGILFDRPDQWSVRQRALQKKPQK